LDFRSALSSDICRGVALQKAEPNNRWKGP
jgi:hypothetical protein